MNVTLALLYEAFGMDDTHPVRRLVRKAEAEAGLAALVVSVAVREGHALGSGSADLLARQRRRAATYERVLAGLADLDGRVLKGRELARLYPPGVLRPVGDLDLCLADEQRLWEAGSRIRREHGALPTLLSRVETGARTHYYLGLQWPSEDPLMESDYEIELVTFPYLGDEPLVPLADDCPDRPVLTQLFALAEERFQRPFTVKDLLDCAALLHAHPDGLVDAGDVLAAFHLAPEVAELLDRTAQLLPACVPGTARTVADAAAARERERRASARAATARRAGARVSYGVLLDDDGPRPTEVRRLPTPDGEVLRTPVADYLMVAGDSVDARAVERASAARRALADDR